MEPGKIEEAETLPMNGTAAAAQHKPVEISMSNAMTYYTTNYRYSSMHRLDKYSAGKKQSMNGVKRVFAFCCLTAVLPAFLIICPLYLKHRVFKDHVYHVTESDILEIREGISTVFCQEHRLSMDVRNFNAFQLDNMPRPAPKMKKIVLRKTMILPDDTLEYWGFFLLKGATVKLKVCSKHEGSRVLIVKGEKNLRTCGLLDHNQRKNGANFNAEASLVRVTYEHREEMRPEVNANNPKLPLKNDNIVADHESSHNHGGEDLSETTEKKPKRTYPIYYGQLGDEPAAKQAQRTEMSQRRRRSHNHELHADHKMRHLPPHQNNNAVRDKRDTIFDGRISHGGNNQEAVNKGRIMNAQGIYVESESSQSSFEDELLDCYDGDIIANFRFNASKNCAHSSTFNHTDYTQATHEIVSDGYYYYIFYSDNDLDQNEINAVFEIQKPTYLYSNISDTKQCSNSTHCSFPIRMMSDEVVIVEVPTQDGIENEEDDVTVLHSQCIPRTSVYVIFPIAVLVLVLSCAFI